MYILFMITFALFVWLPLSKIYYVFHFFVWNVAFCEISFSFFVRAILLWNEACLLYLNISFLQC